MLAGDFDSDGKDDVLVVGGTRWFVSTSSCVSAAPTDDCMDPLVEHQDLGPHTYQQFASHYAVADLDGDGIDDVFFGR